MVLVCQRSLLSPVVLVDVRVQVADEPVEATPDEALAPLQVEILQDGVVQASMWPFVYSLLWSMCSIDAFTHLSRCGSQFLRK